ncbi:zinc finger CCHC domain-containing protein 3-like [Hyperolius riggenbachi]|uniref:zinc finger CCHC domain-containing protein 3-like n=1 Tax=Hyperolius riggenbachi TaxID=752182 RepID=UPI0035A3171B
MEAPAESAHYEEQTAGKATNFTRLRNGIRFLFDTRGKKNRGLDIVVTEVLEKIFHVQQSDLLAILDHPKMGVYDVVLSQDSIFNKFLVTLEKLKDDPRLKGFKIIPHYDHQEKTLIVRMYSPLIPEETVIAFLQSYCVEVHSLGKILNEWGIWTGKWMFAVIFKDTKIPERFSWDHVTGHYLFDDVTPFCSNCKKYGHEWDICNKLMCSRCGGEGHKAKQCGKDRVCFLCKKTGHVSSNCPQRKKRGPTMQEVTSVNHDLTGPGSSQQIETMNPQSGKSAASQSGSRRKSRAQSDSQTMSDPQTRLAKSLQLLASQLQTGISIRSDIQPQPPCQTQVKRS